MKLKVRAAFDRRAKLCKQTFILIPHSFLIRGIEFLEFLMISLGWKVCWKLKDSKFPGFWMFFIYNLVNLIDYCIYLTLNLNSGK